MNIKKFLFSTLLAQVSSFGFADGTGNVNNNKLYPEHFALNEITLNDSPLRDAMTLNIDVLLEYDVDRLLTPFIRQAGLSNTTDATSLYYKWITKHPSFSNWGLSDWSLEGHVGGHYLTALALAIGASQNDASLAAKTKQLTDRLEYMIKILKDCQDAYSNSTTGMKGFIGGQPINQIWTGLYSNNLTEFKKYGGWVPFYCQHKVLAGLRDAYVYAGNETAKELFRGLADWSVNVVSKLSTTDMQTVLGWEHGGMNETLADAYYLFGDTKYLAAAKKYSHTYEINGMQTLNTSFLNGQHANTQVPKFIGFERIYQLDNSATTYIKAALNFWQDVSANRTVCIGGNSVDEHFLAASNAINYINNLNGPESCNSNNMLKLSEALFDETHDGKYADFYEQTMLNHILSTQDPTTGGYVYFTSLRPQSYRIYSKVNQAMWCCVGTGMENHSKYGHFIYTQNPSTNTLYVNLFVASELNDEIYGIKQETQYPYEQQSKLTVTKSGTYSIAIRKPSWVAEGYDVKVNGTNTNATSVKGYVTIQRTWSAGDVITVNLPMTLRTEECPNLKEYVAFKYGPILLAAKTTSATSAEASATGLPMETLQNEYGAEGRMDHAPGSRATGKSVTSSPMLICNPDTVLNLISNKDVSKLLFTIKAPADYAQNAPSSLWNTTQTLTLEPFANIHHARYNCYWYLQSKEDFLKSDLGQTEAIAQSLNERTLDYVGTGEQQSEVGHEVQYSNGSTVGQYQNETYRDAQAGGYIQYVLENKLCLSDSLSIMCRFTTADKNRKATISVDGKDISGVITIPSTYLTANATGFYNVEYKIPSDLLLNADGTVKQKLTFRITASSGTFCPGLYYLRLVKQTSPTDVSQGTYRFVAKDWTTGDAGRVAASKFTYNADNTFSVNAGTGNNNVALMLDINKAKYTVNGLRKYLVIRATNLSIATGKSYLWWLNGVNKGSQVAPVSSKKLVNGDYVIVFDTEASGLNANSTGELYSFAMGQTIFGLTSSTGTSVIKEITFVANYTDYINDVNYLLGDADKSGKVDIEDAKAIVNAYVGNTPAVYNAKAADYNQDGKVSVADANGIVNMK